MSKIRFLVFSDLHYDHVFDAEERLDSLIRRINDLPLDFVISLGDLCFPISENRPIIRKLQNIGIPFYYCVGNHDCENSSRQAIEEFVGLSKLFYSIPVRNIKFIILNTCFMEHDQKEMLYQKGQFEKNADLYPVISRLTLCRTFGMTGKSLLIQKRYTINIHLQRI